MLRLWSLGVVSGTDSFIFGRLICWCRWGRGLLFNVVVRHRSVCKLVRRSDGLTMKAEPWNVAVVYGDSPPSFHALIVVALSIASLTPILEVRLGQCEEPLPPISREIQSWIGQASRRPFVWEWSVGPDHIGRVAADTLPTTRQDAPSVPAGHRSAMSLLPPLCLHTRDNGPFR